MLFTILEFVATLAGIVLPLLPLNRLYKKAETTSPQKQRQHFFSDYAVDEYGNLVEHQ